jgi:hypothetical protein
MFAAAMWFNSGIFLFADAESDGHDRVQTKACTILPKQYGSQRGCASSVFVVSEPGNRHVPAFHHCEDALANIPPEECTIERMRRTVEQTLVDNADDEIDFVALYAPKDQQYSLFRTIGARLQEVVGCDCEGPAASLGHCLMHDRYTAARSMDTLDLTTVFSIAVETLEGVRATNAACGKSSEMVVMYADGHVSDVQHLAHDTRKKRNAALTALGRT